MSKHILVVEDQDDLREIARFASEDAGYEAPRASPKPKPSIPISC